MSKKNGNVLRKGVFALLLGVAFAACNGRGGRTLIPYKNDDGAFTVLLPGKPELTAKSRMTPFGTQTVHMVKWKPSGMEIYKIKVIEIQYMNSPASLTSDTTQLNIMLDSSIKMKEKEYTEKPIHVESIEFNGYPGRSFIYNLDNDNAVAVVKQFIAYNHLYEITVTASSNQGTSTEIGDFFNSFQVLH